MNSGDRGMNPVAMTIINPRKEYWPCRRSNQRPPVLKSCTLPTELWGSAISNEQIVRTKTYEGGFNEWALEPTYQNLTN